MTAPGPRPRGSFRLSEATLCGLYPGSLASGLSGSLLCLAVALLMPGYLSAVTGMGVKLPLATQVLVDLSPELWWLLAPLWAPLVCLKDRRLVGRARDRWNTGLALLSAGAALGIGLLLHLPFDCMCRSLAN